MSGDWKFPKTDLSAMHAVLFTNVRIFDGSGADTFDGEVRVEGERIVAVAAADQRLPCKGEA